jgi:hypothetical protein
MEKFYTQEGFKRNFSADDENDRFNAPSKIFVI